MIESPRLRGARGAVRLHCTEPKKCLAKWEIGEWGHSQELKSGFPANARSDAFCRELVARPGSGPIRSAVSVMPKGRSSQPMGGWRAASNPLPMAGLR
jgi:hypothetical protein